MTIGRTVTNDATHVVTRVNDEAAKADDHATNHNDPRFIILILVHGREKMIAYYRRMDDKHG